MMMMIPATTLKIVRREARNAPTSVADAPRAINTTEKPITKATAFRMTRAISAPSALPSAGSITLFFLDAFPEDAFHNHHAAKTVFLVHAKGNRTAPMICYDGQGSAVSGRGQEVNDLA